MFPNFRFVIPEEKLGRPERVFGHIEILLSSGASEHLQMGALTTWERGYARQSGALCRVREGEGWSFFLQEVCKTGCVLQGIAFNRATNGRFFHFASLGAFYMTKRTFFVALWGVFVGLVGLFK